MTPTWDGESYCTECDQPALFDVPCGMVGDIPVVEGRCAFHAEGFDVEVPS